ncbi:MAG: 5-oxoprolinase subunit C [Catillopecten margaritatus gill symbiont]|uniref:5-oxoprolinase subunit C n=1 Tax=Catillopecten margaritatus gill symbiont TaxID=3083288 RepID=A0AAU6PFL7_9GAMM
MSFKVIKSNFLATIQDYGRLNHGEHGLGQSGIADEHAYCWGNYLLDNAFNCAVIEITFGTLVLEAQVTTFIAVTGADLDFKINNTSVAIWRTVQVHKGDILSWGNSKHGLRAYLSVKSGFNTPIFFDSKSVNLREKIGTPLKQGDTLPCIAFNKTNARFIPSKYLPDYNQALALRILPSYQFNLFTTEAQKTLFNQFYTIGKASDRAGCRLEGAPIEHHKKTMVSEGMAYGSVEIANGLPIILLKDAPNIGGYPKIGTVFSLDLAQLAQRHPNTLLRFEPIDIKTAQSERKEFNQFFKII